MHHKKRIALAATAILLVVGTCVYARHMEPSKGGNTQIHLQQSSGSTPVVVPKAKVVPLGATQHWLSTQDGYQVAAWYWAPLRSGSPGVILAHMRGADKSSFAGFAAKLVEEGYSAIAIDFRGHGATMDPQGRQTNLADLADKDYLAMLSDISAAHEFLDSRKEVDGDRVAVVGASIGANLGIMYAAGDRRVRTVVGLSPGLDYRGLKPIDYLEGYGQRALYLVVSKQDAYSFQSCQAIKQAAREADPISLRAFEGTAHGTDLLAAHQGLDMTIITGWLYNHLPPNN